MRARRGARIGAWLAGLGLAMLCALALAAWLDPAHTLAWVQWMTLCQ